MKPIEYLMQEHRRIEKVVDELKLELQNQQRTQTPNTGKIMTAIDFFQTYADLTHHEKEENIFFAKLKDEEFSEEHKTLLTDLINDHEQARLLVNQLKQQNESYRKGEENIVHNMSNTIQKLNILYSEHIKKEEHFFRSVMNNYFSQQDQEKIINEFNEFDKKMIHKKYEGIIEHMQEL